MNRDKLAEQLDISDSAVMDRLEPGREQLIDRLMKRDVSLTAVGFAADRQPFESSRRPVLIRNPTTIEQNEG